MPDDSVKIHQIPPLLATHLFFKGMGRKPNDPLGMHSYAYHHFAGCGRRVDHPMWWSGSIKQHV